MKRYIPLLSLFGLLGTYAPAAAAWPLDVVGITVGMTAKEAVAAIKAHNPRIKHFALHGSTLPRAETDTGAWAMVWQTKIDGVPIFIDSIRAQDDGPARHITIPTMPDVRYEEIVVGLTPGSPTTSVVYGVHRKVQYKRGQEAAFAAVVSAIKEKYGPPSAPRVYTGSTDFRQRWFFEADGKLSSTDRSAVTPGVQGCVMPAPGWAGSAPNFIQGFGSPTYYVNEMKCGSWVEVVIQQNSPNNDVVDKVEVTIEDSPLRGTRFRAAYKAATEYVRQQRTKETGEAAKRGGGKF